MNGPKRLRDGAGDDRVRRVLQSARLDEPPSAAQERLLVRMGVGVAALTATAVTKAAVTTSMAPAATALSAGTGLIGIVKWIGIGVIAGGLTIGGLNVVKGIAQPSDHAPESSNAARPAAIPKLPAAAPPQVLSASQTSDEQRPQTSVPEPPSQPRAALLTPQATPSTEQEAPTPQPSASTPSPLAIETEELGHVRAAMAQGRPADALALLDGFSARHPWAVLGEEATVLRVEALMASGAVQSATALADEFLRTRRSSAYADRIRSLVRRPATAADSANRPTR
jgi:hypothetical protein